MVLLFARAGSYAQVSYLDRPDLLDRVDSCIKHTYNFSFSVAREFQQTLRNEKPEHPVPYFLEALIIYWENFPLTPGNANSGRFEDLMTRSVRMAEEYINSDKTHLEGVFFDLFGRAFKAMYYADNGKPAKIIPDLRTMYRHTKEGFELKERFSEFYFSTGLYNYYIEAYPEAHPVYKPILSFMEGGDKELGLIQLNYAINNTVFLKVESMLFMSIIQLKYEKDLNTALLYAERLHREYPQNIFYHGHMVIILLHQHRYQRVRNELESLSHYNDRYAALISSLAEAFLAEKERGDDNLAEKYYLETEKIADSFGPFADIYKAIVYMGLSRLNKERGRSGDARSYERKASNLTFYSFILDE